MRRGALRLQAGATGTVPAVPAEAASWHDYNGRVAGYGFTVGGDHWMRLPGIGSFRFADDGEEVTSFAEPGVSRERILDTYRRAVLPMALQALGWEVLHASAVRMGNGVVALCAVSGTGKSTVAYGLSRRGHRLFADDAVPYDLTGPIPRAIPLPFELHLRPQSASFLGTPTPGFSEKAEDEAPLAALCVLERADPSASGGPVRIQLLSPAGSFPRVLAHAYCFSLESPERRGLMADRYMELVSRVPVFEVRLWPGLHNLERVLDEIEGAVQRAAPRDS